MSKQKYVLGRHRTEEEKDKIRAGVIGNTNFLGKHHTEESRQLISKALKGRKFSTESIKKMSEAQKGPKSHRWRGGVSNEPYPFEFNDVLKGEIRKRDEHTCQCCGMTEEEHLIVYGIPLHVHHIDYDKKNCDKNNLNSLCKACNSRVNFNREHWKEHFISKLVDKTKKNVSV